MFKQEHQQRQCTSLGECLLFAEGHLHKIGASAFSPTAFVLSHKTATAAIYPNTKLRPSEIVPGLRLRSGTSLIDVVRVFPTNKEMVYKTSKGNLVRMPTDRFIQLAKQQGYKKVWDTKSFLISLKDLLKPVLDSVSVARIMRWVLDEIRGKKPLKEKKNTERLA